MANNSKHIILITENNRNENALRNALATRPVEIETGNTNLYSVEDIRATIQKTRTTTFIRADLFNFIRTHGMPYFIGLDYTIDLGLGSELDPDKRKLLRTFLISCIVLSRGKGFEDIRANFLLFADPPQLEEARSLVTRPEAVLSMLRTRDEKVNRIINTLKGNTTLFNRLFYFGCVDNSLQSTGKEKVIAGFVEAIDARAKLSASIAGKIQSREKDTPGGPAQVVVKREDGRVIVDSLTGKSSKIADAGAMKPGQVYIVGDWTNVHIRSVADKIITLVKKGTDDFSFTPEDQIVLHLGNLCTIDGTTATSLAQLLVNQLHGYDITLMVSPENQRILEKSNGYSMIRNYIKYSS
ncbi:MAG: hypothetical protein ACOCWZ_02305 [Spirochaetota bacterium]